MTTHRRRSYLACSTGLASLSLLLVGCDNAESKAAREAGEQIQEGTLATQKASLLPTTSFGADVQQSNFNEAVQAVSADGGTTGQAAAKHAISAEALMGLARLELTAADAVNRAYLQEAASIQGLLDKAARQHAIIAGLETYNFSDAISRLEAQRADNESRRRDLQAQRTEAREQVEALQGRLEAEQAAEAALRNESAEIKESASSVPLEEQIAVLERAAAKSREADAKTAAAAELESMLELARPRLVEIESQLVQLELTQESVANSIADLNRRSAEIGQQVTIVRGELQETAREIDRRYSDLQAQWTNSVIPAMDAAIAQAERASSEARQATARAAAGTERMIAADQLLAQTLEHKARSIENMISLVERLQGAAPVLGRGGEDGPVLEDLRSRLQETKTQQAEAYGSALESARTELGDAHPLVRDLQGAFNLASGTITADQLDSGIADAGDDSPRPAADPSVTPATTPAELFRAAASMIRQQNYAGLMTLAHTDTPEETELMNEIGSVLTSFQALDRACVTAYGRDFVTIISDPAVQQQMSATFGGGGGGGMGMPMDFGDMDLTGGVEEAAAELDSLADTTTFSFDSAGTTAWVEGDPMLSDLNFVLIGDEWKIDVEMPAAAAEMEMTKRMLGAVKASLDTTEERVTTGAFGDGSEAAMGLIGDLMQRMLPIIEEMFNSMGMEMPMDG